MSRKKDCEIGEKNYRVTFTLFIVYYGNKSKNETSVSFIPGHYAGVCVCVCVTRRLREPRLIMPHTGQNGDRRHTNENSWIYGLWWCFLPCSPQPSRLLIPPFVKERKTSEKTKRRRRKWNPRQMRSNFSSVFFNTTVLIIRRTLYIHIYIYSYIKHDGIY